MARNAQYLIDEASQILCDYHNKTSSVGLRNLLYASQCPKHMVPILTSVVNGTQTHYEQLLAVAQEAGVGVDNHNHDASQRNHWELAVVLYECLLGSRRVRGTSNIVTTVKQNKALLQQTLAQRRKRGDTQPFQPKLHPDQSNSSNAMPRYVRVNTLKCSLTEAIRYLTEDWSMKQVDLELGSSSSNSSSNNNNFIPPLQPHTFALDPHIPNLLILPPKTNLHGDPFCRDGKFVLQDRSSCLTATVLLTTTTTTTCTKEKGDNQPCHMIDTCAAPGNKTSQLAALAMAHPLESKVFALERSPARIATLQARMQALGASDIVTTVGCDFLKVDLTPFQHVRFALCDPSCSGSGMMLQHHHHQQHNPTQTTLFQQPPPDLTALSNQQLAIVSRALQELPQLQALAYSTCSVHAQENEGVVQRILEANPGWRLTPRILPSWPHRGLPEFTDIAPHVLRASLVDDSTNGFFVARFERRTKADKLEKKSKKKQKEKKQRKRKLDDCNGNNDDNGGDGEKKQRKKSKKHKKSKREEPLEPLPCPLLETKTKESSDGESNGVKEKKKKKTKKDQKDKKKRRKEGGRQNDDKVV